VQAQFNNLVLSSFALWLDHIILSKGLAYTNFSSRFYKINNSFNGLYSYGLPFKQISVDSSIPGANIMSGIYINNTFITRGTSGLVDINFEAGHAYFSQNVDGQLLSGNFAVKDFNIKFTNLAEETLLFETKYELRPKTDRQITGLATNTETYPIMFIKSNGSENYPLAFGGLDTTEVDLRVMILADNPFNLDAACSIIRDRARTFIPLFTAGDMPFNAYGGFKSGNYNYSQVTSPKLSPNELIFIKRVQISNYNLNSPILRKFSEINPLVYPALVNFELVTERYPHV
jgi:hypothetical protein